MTLLLPELPYTYDALEPFYDRDTVEIHHSKHHQAYTDKLNAAIDTAWIDWIEIEDILKSLDNYDESVKGPLRNHWGWYFNHTFFWESMSPNPTQAERKPVWEIATVMEQTFWTYEQFKDAFTIKAWSHFGSWWAWLVMKDWKLLIVDTHDQVCPLTFWFTPLLCIDVWEHAYYLKYKNKRPEWIENFFHIINWEKVNERYTQK